jgi:mono/diheme cytochrome c family protein
MSNNKLIFWFLLQVILLAACAPQQPIMEGPTPIPTLIPVSVSLENIEPTQVTPQVIEGYPAGIPSAQAGLTLYNEHCAECHGVDGVGVVPNARNFSDVDYMRGETPGSFYLIITEGRRQDMPAFGDILSSDDRWDASFYVWRFSTNEEKLTNGESIYTDNCVACHGENGRSMILGAADLSDLRFMGDRSPSDLYLVITQGRGSMPAFQARLSQDERWDVIDYLYTFTYDPDISADEGLVTSPEAEPAQIETPQCAAYIDQANPNAWGDSEATAAGEAVYANCESCHGSDGKGRLPATPDFSSPSFKARLREKPSIYYCSVAEGLEAMPAYESILSESEIWQILTYIDTFSE